MKIDFGQFIFALSDTIDLVGVDEIQHGKRVGFMAYECAKTMGQSITDQIRLCRLGLLHDCGVSSTRIHKQLVDELDWSESHYHCRIGAERLRRFPPLDQLADAVLHHHTHWEELRNQSLPASIKDEANLIFLLDRVDALAAIQGQSNRLAIRDTICRKIESYRNSYFKSELVDIFLATATREAFWITQQPEHLRDYLKTEVTFPAEIHLNIDQLMDMAKFFAEVVDAKSPYTAEHSFGVARLADYLARKCELDSPTVTKITAAGLLHDLGKLQVPDIILEHNGYLEGENLAVMRHHSYVTHMILNRIAGIEEIALWASNHHEKIDGTGYPYRRKGKDLSIESRIIMVADIFQALAQNRPYRASLPCTTIVEMLVQMATDGKLDREIVTLVQSDPDTCLAVATTQHTAS
jgi:putative nucleotidyltransferase with HDIG domain